MAIEIERKFLLKNTNWKPLVTKTHEIKQGYLQSGLEDSHSSSVRIRISDALANINIKSADPLMLRQEYEYPIPLADAEEMLNKMCDSIYIEKKRHHVVYTSKNTLDEKTHIWEIDIFENDNEGLAIAEIELSDINEVFELPDWIGEEVTDDKRYYNNYLLYKPFSSW